MTTDPPRPLETACSPHPDIHIHGLNTEEGAMTLVMEGQIRYQSVASLQEFLFERVRTHAPRSLCLDLQRISFLDSQGLALLIALYKHCTPQGCTLTIRNAPPHVRNLLKITRINLLIKLV